MTNYIKNVEKILKTNLGDQWFIKPSESEPNSYALAIKNEDTTISVESSFYDPISLKRLISAKIKFNKFKLLHDFSTNDEPLKGWIDETNFINVYENWDSVMNLIGKVESMMFLELPYKFKLTTLNGIRHESVLVDNIEFLINATEVRTQLYYQGCVTDILFQVDDNKFETVYNALLSVIKWIRNGKIE